jgi:PTS system fructose-specific IIC component
MPSATGNGVAFLHTHRRSPEHVVRPFLVFGRSREGVDFEALDGAPVHFFFVLGLKYQELHLPWLAKLVRMVAQPGATERLLTAPDAQALFHALSDAERKLEPVRAVGS